MMRREIAIGLLVVFEHRKLRDDQRFVSAAVDQILASRNFIAQRSERCRDYRIATRDNQYSVTFFGFGGRSELRDLCFAQNFQKR